MLTLMFVISMQPFMELVKDKVRSGELQGIQVREGKELTHQLFADDIGLFFLASQENFRCIRDIITRYEEVLGTCLNLSKSVLIPLYLSGPMPKWMRNARCKVAARREVINYLGCPIGYEVTPA